MLTHSDHTLPRSLEGRYDIASFRVGRLRLFEQLVGKESGSNRTRYLQTQVLATSPLVLAPFSVSYTRAGGMEAGIINSEVRNERVHVRSDDTFSYRTEKELGTWIEWLRQGQARMFKAQTEVSSRC